MLCIYSNNLVHYIILYNIVLYLFEQNVDDPKVHSVLTRFSTYVRLTFSKIQQKIIFSYLHIVPNVPNGHHESSKKPL